MVRLLLISLAFVAIGAFAEPDVRFAIEFTKAEVYAGEPVTAHFVVYGRDDVLDVEVAKFPEFRGFWSENLALRQGPIPLLQDFSTKEWKKSVVGSYLISSMIEEKDPIIRPMKLVVRRPQHQVAGEANPDLVLLSEGPALVIKPLPPPPASLAGKFSGGVGRFTLQAERSPVLFRRDEPTILRFVLSGEGNFREINEINLPELPQMEILSKKSYSQGSAQYYTKSYEITVAVHSDENLTLPAFNFSYFDPLTATYEYIPIAEIRFEKAPDPVGGPTRDTPVDLGLPYTAISTHTRWIDGITFWVLQIWIFLGFLAASSRAFGWQKSLARRFHVRRREDPWRPRFAAAEAALKAGDVDGFLGQADRLAFDILAAKVPNPPVTRSELLRRSSGYIKEERLSGARTLFDAWSARAYSSKKPLPPSTNPLLEALSALVREAA